MDESAERKEAVGVAAKERAAEKKRLRLAALASRDTLTDVQRRDYSDRIVKSLVNLPCYQEADAILTYVSFRSEVDTFPLLEQAFADGKAVFAPKVIGKEMTFYQISSPEDLTEGYHGILEPSCGYSYEEWIDDQSGQCILICMPGAAFDRARHRIGYGGGFYDRFLSKLLESEKEMAETARPQVKMTTAALAFSCQIFEEIPWEAHDICPEHIIAETEIV